MTRELIIYICTCSKCKHVWNTKTHTKPDVCAKCHRKTWNDDEVAVSAPIIAAPAPIKTSNSTTSDVNDWLERMRAKKGSPPIATYEPETINEWAGWSEERRTVENGDVITYRQHLKTGKVKEIGRESDLATA